MGAVITVTKLNDLTYPYSYILIRTVCIALSTKGYTLWDPTSTAQTLELIGRNKLIRPLLSRTAP